MRDTSKTTKEFEKVLSSEEGTQFDFYLETDKKTYTFEIKYSENAFGDTEKDEKHEIKYDSIYKERLKSVVNNLSEEEFFEEYQLWRNICFAAENKEVHFVFPEFRQDLTEIVKNAKDKCKESVKGKINYIHVEEFVTKMKSSNDENLRKHYTEFYRKYLKVL